MMLPGRPAGKRARWTIVGAALLAAAHAFGLSPSDWPQWGGNPQHTGASPVVGQRLETILANLVYDPFVEQMKLEAGGSLLAHYAVPLLEGPSVYMVFKSGQYLGTGVWDSIVWSVKKLEWNGETLETVWTFESDWKPEPLELTNWESVFLPALSGDSLYVPGLGGSVHRVSKATGLATARINPFATVDPDVYVAGGLGVAPDGGVVYNAIGLATPDPRAPNTGAWLVRIAPNGVASRVDFPTLVAGAPAPTDLCQGSFAADERPWPPSPTAVPPAFPCGAQRPGINVVPAFAPDGTIYTVSRAHANNRYSYLVAVHPDLTPAWSASLRGLLDDGCGVLVPRDGTTFGCRANAPTGVDPATNDQPAGRVNDAGTSSPVVLPDGAILIGTSTSYNFSRGHLFKFDASGGALATYDFGWDITPGVFAHDGTYSILIKDNHYFDTAGNTFYDVTSLDANLSPEWSVRATNTESCARQPSGSIVCVDDHPDGFEWCINQPAIGADGTLYLNGEDGVLYAFDRSGDVVGQIFLDTALGAAYTPVALGPDGVVYTQNNGRLFAIGQARSSRLEPVPPAGGPRATRLVERE
jgi:hypothetical protein